MKPRVGDSEDEMGTVILEGNLDVNQGAGWSALLPLSGRRLSSVDLQAPSPWSRGAGSLWRVRMEIMTYCQVYIPWTQEEGILNPEVTGTCDQIGSTCLTHPSPGHDQVTKPCCDLRT